MNFTLGCYTFQMIVNLYDGNCITQALTRNFSELTAKHIIPYMRALYVHGDA